MLAFELITATDLSRGIIKTGIYCHRAISKAISFVIVGICLLGIGCQDVATIWSAEARSPDGNWLASAHTEQHGGPGTAGVETIVYLSRTNVSKPPEAVLSFFHDPSLASQSGKTIDLSMKWPAPTHLEVTYDGHATLGLQVVKYYGVDISVRDLSRETTSTSR
jgi:hypothetical protein